MSPNTMAVRRTPRLRFSVSSSWANTVLISLSMERAAGDHRIRRRLPPGVIWRRRGQLPLETMRTFPDLVAGYGLAVLHALPDEVREEQLRQAEAEASDRGHHVPVRELHRVVRNTARHAGQSEEVLREEQDVHE